MLRKPLIERATNAMSVPPFLVCDSYIASLSVSPVHVAPQFVDPAERSHGESPSLIYHVQGQG